MTDDTESAYATATNDSDSEMEGAGFEAANMRQIHRNADGNYYPRGRGRRGRGRLSSIDSEDDIRSLFNDDLLMAENEEMHWERIAEKNGRELKDALEEIRRLRSAIHYLNKENAENQKIILMQKQVLKKKDRLLKKKTKKVPKFLEWNCIEDIIPTNDNGVLGTKRFLHKNLQTLVLKL